MDTKLIVSASPHVRSEETTQSLMARSEEHTSELQSP